MFSHVYIFKISCIFASFRFVQLTARKLVWYRDEVSFVQVMFVLFRFSVVVNHVAEHTIGVVTRMFLTGYVINMHWIVCAETEHVTETSAVGVEHVTINNFCYILYASLCLLTR